MPLRVNIRELLSGPITLRGELPAEDYQLETFDEMIRVAGPVVHDLEVQRVEDELLVHGTLRLVLACECVRCLKPFRRVLELADWSAVMPLVGEEALVVGPDETADLTLWIREDILLALPQHPVCDPQCPGLLRPGAGASPGGAERPAGPEGSVWSELDKLKF
ncbi:MAG: YceD family protein [Verrucomicrobiae bacterium]|nr:YceD family protein [Verrucomicrobiae bacterium]